MTLNLSLPNKLKVLFTTLAKVIIVFGGRASGKSWGIMLYLVIMGMQYKLRILCTRETSASMDYSSYKLMADTIARLQIAGWEITQ